jgi:spore coat polysaccharide biosynthesis protein SpsF
MEETVLVIVQARMESTRFYGKVCAPLLGQPLLLWLLDRISSMRTPHRLVVASPGTPANHAIADLCAKHGYTCELVAGDPNDVLGRFHVVAHQYGAKTIIRLCGDTPLIDPTILDGLLAFHHAHSIPSIIHRGMLSGEQLAARRVTMPPALTGIGIEWGDGFDCAVISRTALDTAFLEAELPSDREHVEPFIFRNAQRFRCCTYPCPFNMSWLRLSVDTADDLAMVEMLLEACLVRYGSTFGWRDLLMTIETKRRTVAGMSDIKARMAARPHNQAYVAQVAREQVGVGAQNWADLRYGGVS